MDRTLPAVITGLVVIVLFALMWRSWRARRRRDSGLAAGYPAPASAGANLAAADCFYVATTPRDQPLERLAIAGLGFRARAEITVTDAGLWLALRGEMPVYLPHTAIDLLTPATVAIDRVVEKDGLLRLGWRLAPAAIGTAPGTVVAVDSYFRIPDSGDRRRLTVAIRSISAIDSPVSTPTTHDESEA